MKKTFRSILVVWCGIWLSSVTIDCRAETSDEQGQAYVHVPQTQRASMAETSDEHGQAYVIAFHFKLMGPNGRQLEGGPILGTTEGRLAEVSIGKDIKPPQGLPDTYSLLDGVHLAAHVFRKDGKLYLDAKAEVTDASSTEDASVRVTLRTHRIVKAIELDKTVLISNPKLKNEIWEVVVRKAPTEILGQNRKTIERVR